MMCSHCYLHHAATNIAKIIIISSSSNAVIFVALRDLGLHRYFETPHSTPLLVLARTERDRKKTTRC